MIDTKTLKENLWEKASATVPVLVIFVKHKRSKCMDPTKASAATPINQIKSLQ